MTTYAQKPLEVYFRQDQIEALEGLAQARGVAVADLVRQSVDAWLTTVPTETEPAAEAVPGDDALWDIVGIVDSDIEDMATEHDRYLAEMLEEAAPGDDALLDLIGMFDSGLGDMAAEHDRYLVEFLEEENRSWPAKSS